MNDITRQKLLQSIPRDEKIILIPNPGNAGDSIIMLGILQFLNDYGIDFEIGNILNTYSDKFLMYGGGGNLISLYNNCKEFILRNSKENTIIILPHTVSGVDDLLRMNIVKDNIIFFCREMTSYEYVKCFSDNVYLDHDMAFSISKDYLSKYDIPSSGVLN